MQKISNELSKELDKAIKNNPEEAKKLNIKIFSNAEILSFNMADNLNIKDVKEFKLLQMVVFQTIKDLKKHDLLNCDLEELI